MVYELNFYKKIFLFEKISIFAATLQIEMWADNRATLLTTFEGEVSAGK
ncbi:hypothetical protein BARVI_07945 [Barnesiella viscericola DSM 18177]|uniref:Uncharacterized protein n=1 Tax=Barnesiella viscericola DSM 18177 TaxID=880074 RepID=W0EXA9_9BACT|nr:hypothetical protein BARVI_07945 [Barnesiella viscericola DSM 18177]